MRRTVSVAKVLSDRRIQVWTNAVRRRLFSAFLRSFGKEGSEHLIYAHTLAFRTAFTTGSVFANALLALESVSALGTTVFVRGHLVTCLC